MQEEQQTTEVTTGSVGGRNPFGSRKNLAMAVAAVVVVVAVLGAAVWWFSNYQAQHRAYVQAGKFAVDATQYKQMEAEAKSDDKLSPDAYLNHLKAIAQRRAVAQTLTITPSQTEQKEAAAKLYPQAGKLDAWQQLRVYDTALDAAVQRLATDAVAGYIFVFPFSPAPPAAGTKYAAQQNLYNQSRLYAQQQAIYYHNKVAQGGMTDADALKAMQTDPKLNAGTTVNKSTKVETDSSAWLSDTFYQPIAGDMIGNGKTGYSPVQLSRKADQESRVNKPVADDTYYYFYHLTSVQHRRTKLAQQFAGAVQKQKVTVEVPRRDD